MSTAGTSTGTDRIRGLTPRSTSAARPDAGPPFWAREVRSLGRALDELLGDTALGVRLLESMRAEAAPWRIGAARVLARDPLARGLLESWFVRPLARFYELARSPRTDLEALARALAEDAERGFLMEVGEGAGWRRLARRLTALACGAALEGGLAVWTPGTRDLLGRLAHALPRSPHLAWGAVLPLVLYAEARARCWDDPQRAAERLAVGIDRWLAALPVDLCRALPGPQIERDLDRLAARFAIDREIRPRLAARFVVPAADRAA